MIKPRALRPGDRIVAISLSSGWPNVFSSAYGDGKRQLEEVFGVEVIESRHALAGQNWRWPIPRLKRLETTLRYSHWGETDLREAGERLTEKPTYTKKNTERTRARQHHGACEQPKPF